MKEDIRYKNKQINKQTALRNKQDKINSNNKEKDQKKTFLKKGAGGGGGG